jgi:hypothetical protein
MDINVVHYVQNQSLVTEKFVPKTPGVTTTSKIIRKVLSEGQPELCTICLEIMHTKLGVLSCNHRFHFRCIDRWIRCSACCPICRRQCLQ